MTNYQNPMSRVGEMVKTDKFWSKKGQKDFCQNFHLGNYSNIP